MLVPAVSAQLVEIDETQLRFRHPLIAAAIRQHASVSQRQAAHAALARALARQPERAVWHRAAAIIGPDEAVADELEATALRAHRRGASAVAVSALRRAATLGDSGRRAGRLLRAAELGFELGRQDLVQDSLAEAGPHDLTPREQARVAWIRDSFADGIPGETSKARSLAVSADRAGADGDTDLALKLLYGAALRCWWADPGEATRDDVAATAEGLKVAEDDPRLLVVLALAAPTGRGATVVERLYDLGRDIESDAATTRLAGNAAMAVGAFDLAASFLTLSAASLRAQGRLGLLARALALQAGAPRSWPTWARLSRLRRRHAGWPRRPGSRWSWRPPTRCRRYWPRCAATSSPRRRWPPAPRRSACRSARGPCSRRRSSPAASPRSGPDARPMPWSTCVASMTPPTPLITTG